MTEKKTYTVHRAMHGGGKDYERGDTREMTELDAAAMVKAGALSLEGEEPVKRPVPAVEHTFGTRPSELNERGYTAATGEGILPPKAPAKPKPART
jgi:hypothetical protein